MWIFSSESLPSSSSSSVAAPFVRWQNEAPVGAPLYSVARQVANPQTQAGAIPAATSPGVYTIPLDAPVLGIELVVIGSQIFTPATDIANLQPGEYYLDPYQQALILASDQPIQEAPYSLGLQGIVVPTDIVRDYPDWLDQLPVSGTVLWTLKLNSQPTGSVELECLGVVDTVKSTLQAGFVLDLWGVGLTVSRPQVKEGHRRNNPYGYSTISANLLGAWEWHSQQQSFLLGIPQDFGGTSSYAIECTPIGGVPPQAGTLKTNTTVQVLAAQVGVPLQAPPLPVKIPTDAQALDTVSWADELQSAALKNYSFIDWNQIDAVKLTGYNATASWSYAEAEIDGEVSAEFREADAAPVRGLIPNWRHEPSLATPFPDAVTLPSNTLQPESLQIKPGFRYTNHKVEGDFLSPQEQGSSSTEVQQLPSKPPTWVQVPSVSKILISGDPDPEVAPGEPKHLSNNADISGVTKRRLISRILNGAPVEDQLWIYGWMFTGEELKSSSSITWGVIEYRRITYNRDAATGYDLGYSLSGYKMIRHKIEDIDEPQTVSMAPGDPARDLYRYQLAPLTGGRSIKLGQIRDYYKSFKVTPPYSVYQTCSATGQIWPVAVIDPNWVEPMFALEELEWSRCIISLRNPSPNAAAPLMAGEQTENHRKVEPIAILSGEGTLNQDPDGYKQYTVEYRAQEAGFARSLEQAPYEEFLGLPPEAAKGKSAYELQQQTSSSSSQEPQTDPQTQGNLYIRSADYDGAPVGSLSFQGIQTLEEFKQAATTNLLEQRFNDLRETVTLAAPNFSIRPGDLLTYVHNGTQRKRRVLEVSNKINVQGMTRSSRQVTGETQLVLSRDADTTISVSQPSSSTSPGNDPPPVVTITIPYYPGRTLGEIEPIPDSAFRY